MTRAGLRELADDVRVIRRRVHYVVACELGVKQIEAVMMLGGDDDELHACILSQLRDGVWVELFRIELLGQRGVFVRREQARDSESARCSRLRFASLARRRRAWSKGQNE